MRALSHEINYLVYMQIFSLYEFKGTRFFFNHLGLVRFLFPA